MNELEWEYRFATLSPEAFRTVWRSYRLSEICAGNTPVKLDQRPTIVVHLFGLEPFTTAKDLQERNAKSPLDAATLGEEPRNAGRWMVFAEQVGTATCIISATARQNM